jgi:hypothetical protein
MRTITLFFNVLLLFSFLISCSPPAYIPNMVNVPLHTSKGEFQAVVGTGTSGIDPQLSYAITDNIGIMTNASFANRTDSTDFHKHRFAELGVGFMHDLGNGGHFEVYGGAGTGTVDAKNYYNLSSNTYLRTKATLTRIFLQPSIGIVTKVFDGAFTPRVVLLNVNHSINNNVVDSTLNNNNFDPFIEPTVTAKVGWKYVKMFFQVGFSVPLTKFKNYTNQRFMFSVGLIGKIPFTKQSETKLKD